MCVRARVAVCGVYVWFWEIKKLYLLWHTRNGDLSSLKLKFTVRFSQTKTPHFTLVPGKIIVLYHDLERFRK